ncbi:MAG: thermitase, partial [Thermoproteota archaeon]
MKKVTKVQSIAFAGFVGALGMSSVASAASFYKGVEVFNSELIVKLKEGYSKSFLAQKSFKGMTVKENLGVAFGDYLVMTVPSSKSLKNSIAYLNSLPEVAFAEPNYKVSIGAYEESEFEGNPRDPEFTKLWGMINTGSNEPNRSRAGVVGADINAAAAWGITKGSKSVKIAVIDTGIEYTHPDLKNNIWTNPGEIAGNGIDDDGNGYIDDVHGYDFANNDGDPRDGHSHGTHCAGTIGAEHDNSKGVAGVMAKVSMVAVKFLSDSGSGSTANAIKSIDYATKLNVDIMSNSWGGGGFSQALMDSITAAKDAGILFVAAAGNSATNNDVSPHYPSNYDVSNVISIAAHNAQDVLASFSCYGKTTVHVAAPGRNILSTVKNGGYKVYSGTSMATPHVAGILGLLLSKEGRSNVSEVRSRLMRSSVYVANYSKKTVSEGRANVYNLLTNTFPDRPAQPDPSLWVSKPLRSAIESAHPYPSNATQEFEIKAAGAKFIRVQFEKVDLENKYDYILIEDAKGNLVDKISGKRTSFQSEY